MQQHVNHVQEVNIHQLVQDIVMHVLQELTVLQLPLLVLLVQMDIILLEVLPHAQHVQQVVQEIVIKQQENVQLVKLVTYLIQQRDLVLNVKQELIQLVEQHQRVHHVQLDLIQPQEQVVVQLVQMENIKI